MKKRAFLCIAGGALLASLLAGCHSAQSDFDNKPKADQVKAFQGDPAKMAEMSKKYGSQGGPPPGAPGSAAPPAGVTKP